MDRHRHAHRSDGRDGGLCDLGPAGAVAAIVAPMFVPVDNRVSMRMIGLRLAIIAIVDASFDFVLADEPATSLRSALPDP